MDGDHEVQYCLSTADRRAAIFAHFYRCIKWVPAELTCGPPRLRCAVELTADPWLRCSSHWRRLIRFLAFKIQ
ncbi:hypothetical protein GW17_00014282 [Ensete ventricosum]|nr:hypothetical protein GW17_00014282 [Ensete ventricosum]